MCDAYTPTTLHELRYYRTEQNRTENKFIRHSAYIARSQL